MQIADTTYRPISYHGHGMIEKASSHNAIAHVINHELRHLQQYRARAMYSGKEVVHENITVVYKFVDGKIIPVKGKAEAVIAEKEKPQKHMQDNEPESESQPCNEKSIDSASDPEKRLNQIENKITKNLERTENKLSGKGLSVPDDHEIPGLESKLRMLKQALQKVEGLKAKMHMDKLNQAHEEILGGLSDKGSSDEGLLESILGLKVGESGSDNGNELAFAANQQDNSNRNLGYLAGLMSLSTGWIA